MNVYVCVKQVPDTETKIRLRDERTVDESSIEKWIVNPFDEYAVEEAVRLKEKLGASIATSVIAFEYGDGAVNVCCEIDEGAQEKIELELPAIVAVSRGINTPRYPPLPSIMKARKKEIRKLTPADVGVAEVANSEEIVGWALPAEKAAGRAVGGEPVDAVRELVSFLTNDAKVL